MHHKYTWPNLQTAAETRTGPSQWPSQRLPRGSSSQAAAAGAGPKSPGLTSRAPDIPPSATVLPNQCRSLQPTLVNTGPRALPGPSHGWATADVSQDKRLLSPPRSHRISEPAIRPGWVDVRGHGELAFRQQPVRIRITGQTHTHTHTFARTHSHAHTHTHTHTHTHGSGATKLLFGSLTSRALGPKKTLRERVRRPRVAATMLLCPRSIPVAYSHARVMSGGYGYWV